MIQYNTKNTIHPSVPLLRVNTTGPLVFVLKRFDCTCTTVVDFHVVQMAIKGESQLQNLHLLRSPNVK